MIADGDTVCLGKGEHHATALDRDGRRLRNKALPQDEQTVRALFDGLSGHGPVVAVVEEPASIGAWPVAIAGSMGVMVVCLPGLAMCRIADLHPGNARTDARDAFIIAEAARTMPHDLRRVGFDDDLADEVTRVSNRIRGLLPQVHPALERVIGPKLHHPAVLGLLTKFGGPTCLREAGRRRLTQTVKPLAPRSWQALANGILDSLEQQIVLAPGTRPAGLVLPKLATHLSELLAQRADAARPIEEILDAHPLSQLLMSMRGVGIWTAARILLDVGDGSAFPTSDHLAAYAGLAPVTRRPVQHPRRVPSRAGNRRLKRALFVAAFAALHDLTSRAYYDRKRAAGKKHNAAPHLSRPTPLRRPPSHAPQRHPLRGSNTSQLDRNHRDTPPEARPGLVVQHLTIVRIAEGPAVWWNTTNNAVLAESKRVLGDEDRSHPRQPSPSRRGRPAPRRRDPQPPSGICGPRCRDHGGPEPPRALESLDSHPNARQAAAQQDLTSPSAKPHPP